MQAAEKLKLWVMNALSGELRIHLVVVLGAIGFLTYIEPFGTGVLPLMERLIYWGIAIPAGFIGGLVFNTWLRPSLIRRDLRIAIPPVHILFMTLFALISVLILEAVFRQPIPLKYIWLLASSVAVIASVIWGITTLSLGPGISRNAEQEDPKFEAFRATWPANLQQAALTAIAAEDHYIRVHTTLGEALIAGRFSDALVAVQNQEGTQVHRSWWVSGRDVQALNRRGGKWHLRIGDQLEIPVSRRFRPEARAKGWDKLPS